MIRKKKDEVKIKRERRKLDIITSQVEQLEVKRKVVQLAVPGGYYGTSFTAASTAGTNVSTMTTGIDRSG